MKKIQSILAIAMTAFVAASCFSVEPHEYEKLNPISISVPSDTINVSLGEELVYEGLNIESTGDLEFQWAYGQPASGTQISDHEFASMDVISSTRTIDYTFTKVGSFILRLRVDNGESIVFKYFTLNVNSGYDEGVAILSNRTDGSGALSFVKTLTADEEASGAQQIFYNIFSVEGKTLKNGTGLFISDNTYKNVTYSGFLIATNDEDGTIYHMDCKTFEYYMSVKMKDFGTYCTEFGGEYAEDKASFGCFYRSPDGRVFRYDMNGGFVNEMNDITISVDRIMTGVTRSTVTSKTTRTPFFFNETVAGTRKTASSGTKCQTEGGWKVINMALARTNLSNGVRVLQQNELDPTSYRVMAGGVNWYSWSQLSTFTASSVNMDSNSKFVNTTESSDVYYTFNNAIYRWNLSSAPAVRPAITLPSGEKIRDIATNFKGRPASSGGEDLLYVATYNPDRSSEHKGSLYVYRFSDDTLVASYVGICDDPVSVIYKYRIN